jgi:hypothetical protein
VRTRQVWALQHPLDPLRRRRPVHAAAQHGVQAARQLPEQLPRAGVQRAQQQHLHQPLATGAEARPRLLLLLLPLPLLLLLVRLLLLLLLLLLLRLQQLLPCVEQVRQEGQCMRGGPALAQASTRDGDLEQRWQAGAAEDDGPAGRGEGGGGRSAERREPALGPQWRQAQQQALAAGGAGKHSGARCRARLAKMR